MLRSSRKILGNNHQEFAVLHLNRATRSISLHLTPADIYVFDSNSHRDWMSRAPAPRKGCSLLNSDIKCVAESVAYGIDA
jgi:hypothetical protein